MTKVEVPKSFADRIRQMGGPSKNQPEFFAGSADDVAELNKVIETLPTSEAVKRFFMELF